MTTTLNTRDYQLTYNKALAAVPGHIVGREGVPDLTDPLHSYLYLEKRRQVTIDSTRQRPLVRLWDGDHKYVGQLAQEKSVTVEEVMTDSGSGNLALRHDNWLSQFILYDRRAIEDLHITIDPIPTMPDWRNRWGGKVMAVNAKRDSDGLHTVEIEALSNREHWKHLLAGANPVSPPEAQLPHMWLVAWNCRTAVTITGIINLARQYCPLLSIPTNVFNPGGWIGGGGIRGLNPLNWPVQMQYINPLLDQSRFSILASRWSDMHTITGPMLEDAGCMVRAYTWLLEDADSPHLELSAGLGRLPFFGPALEAFAKRHELPDNLDDLCRPTRNCVVMAVEDKSGTTGPTGCVAPETLIEGPEGPTRIDILAKDGKPFKVWSLTPQGQKVPAIAAYAFRKGRAELFEYILANGSSIKASKDHRFLTRSGFLQGGEITVGMELATSDADIVAYCPVADISSLGIDDYYDMHVPGWENYAAHGFWNHNTLIDGPIKLIAATADDMITEIVYPADANTYPDDPQTIPGPEGAFFQKLFMVAPPAPWVVFRDTDYSGIIESTRTIHSATARTIHVGNHSPSWVNQLQTFLIKYALSELSTAILAMSPGMGAPGPTSQVPQTPGLEEMYQGQLDDTLLAFQRWTDLRRALHMGALAFLEHREQGAGTAYTIAGVLDIRTGQWKTRDYTSFKTSIRGNGSPYFVNKDFTLGDRLAFQQGNLLYVDQCYSMKFHYDRDTAPKYDLQIGKGTEEEDPVMRATRTLAALWNTVGLAMGSRTMLG